MYPISQKSRSRIHAADMICERLIPAFTAAVICRLELRLERSNAAMAT
jgi:hypothetical protein